jgi:hypothetical protein
MVQLGTLFPALKALVELIWLQALPCPAECVREARSIAQTQGGPAPGTSGQRPVSISSARSGIAIAHEIIRRRPSAPDMGRTSDTRRIARAGVTCCPRHAISPASRVDLDDLEAFRKLSDACLYWPSTGLTSLVFDQPTHAIGNEKETIGAAKGPTAHCRSELGSLLIRRSDKA